MKNQGDDIAGRIAHEIDAVAGESLLREAQIPGRLEVTNRLGRHGNGQHAVVAEPDLNDLPLHLVVTSERFQ